MQIFAQWCALLARPRLITLQHAVLLIDPLVPSTDSIYHIWEKKFPPVLNIHAICKQLDNDWKQKKMSRFVSKTKKKSSNQQLKKMSCVSIKNNFGQKKWNTVFTTGDGWGRLLRTMGKLQWVPWLFKLGSIVADALGASGIAREGGWLFTFNRGGECKL